MTQAEAQRDIAVAALDKIALHPNGSGKIIAARALAKIAAIGESAIPLRGLVFIEDDGSIRLPTTQDI